MPRMLPITRVVLYKHGVGYFERQGSVSGVTSVDLHFKASEMNDVLKSLTTLDLGKGLISSISYESTRPIERQLDDVAVRLDDANAISGLLNQVKGARVAVEIGGKSIEGAVLGIEWTTRKEGDTAITSGRVALLVDGSTMQSYDLLEIRAIRFLDESLRKDLGHLLEILISSKKKDLKKLTIFASGEGERQLFASYIVETPVWKTSYRLLLDTPKPELPPEAPLLQGWALVDNTQDEDWDSVRLSLVAGLPISFVHDLYAPRYKQRPIVKVQEEAAYAPPQLEGAVEYLSDSMPQPAAAPAAFGAAGYGAPPPPPAPAPMTGGRMRAQAATSAPVQTRTVETGDLFQYELRNPVTVKRGQSALVPIMQSPFEGKRVAVYNQDVRAKNPMSAVLFKNTTGATLEGGPVTVLEDATYVGESMLETLKPGEERLVPYSVELGCVVSIDPQSETQNVHFARIVNGYLYLTRYRLDRRTYVILNKGSRPIDLFLEHRFNHGWTLQGDATDGKPIERTENFYRFRLDVPAGKTTRFKVTERGELSDHYAILGLARDQIGVWLQSRWIDAATQQLLLGLADLADQAANLGRRAAQREADVAEIFKNQERLRQNLQALGATQDERGLRERYVGELSREEDRLRELREAIRKDKEDKEAVERELRERVAKLEFQTAV